MSAGRLRVRVHNAKTSEHTPAVPDAGVEVGAVAHGGPLLAPGFDRLMSGKAHAPLGARKSTWLISPPPVKVLTQLAERPG